MLCNIFYFSSVTGPEPVYSRVVSGFKTYTHDKPFALQYNNAVLPELKVAYETWGELNKAKDNAVIIHAGLSASSHAKSHDVSRRLLTCTIRIRRNRRTTGQAFIRVLIHAVRMRHKRFVQSVCKGI